MMERVRSLYTSKMDGLKMDQLNEGIINLAGVYVMSIIIIINMVILG